jgi:ATP phosphoribosyltransferase
LPGVQNNIKVNSQLNFGAAELVVAVPNDWIDVQTIADLEEISFEFKEKNTGKLRVATKYPNLTNEFLLSKGLTQYKIINSLGSTEMYPFTNQSEIITDITSTGATLKANKLRILKDGNILKSSACILVSKKSLRDKYKKTVIEKLLNKIKKKG